MTDAARSTNPASQETDWLVRTASQRVEALERIAAAAQRAFDTGRILPQTVGVSTYAELRDALEAIE